MTLIEIIARLERIIAVQPNIHTVIRNDVYKLNGIPSARYGVMAWTQGTHQMDYRSGMATYQLYLYYIDRNNSRPNNDTEIVSFGIQVLNNIILTLSEQDIFIDDSQIQPFTERFTDDCAGAYATLNIQVPIDRCVVNYGEGDYNRDYNVDFSTYGIQAY